jgi:hypothetical protein
MYNVRFSHLRCLPESELVLLLGLYSNSLNSAHALKDWKRTRIVTVLKPDTDPDLADSYRPISLLSCIGKLFERIFLLRLKLVIFLWEMMWQKHLYLSYI